MTLQELISLAERGAVRELDVLSMEGSLYILRAHLPQGVRTLQDAHGKTCSWRSTSELRDYFRDSPAVRMLPCTLSQQVVHDEMCGTRSGPVEPLRIAFSLDSG